MDSIKKISDNLKTKNIENNPYFSIIIPVYNTEKYLRRCLDSLVNQTFNDIEIIIVNDCSQGNCKEIIEEYQKNNLNKNIKYIRNDENLGSAWSRLNGLSHSSGKYIHFVDSDDWVEKDCYQKIYKYLGDKFDAIYFNGSYADDYKTWEYDFHIAGDLKIYGKRAAFDKMFFNDAERRTLWGRVFKRSILLKGAEYMPKEKISIADDWILNLFTLFFVKKYRTVSDIFYYYYQNNPNAMTAIVENKKDNKISFSKIDNNLGQLYISYNAIVDFLKQNKVWNIYRYSWVLYIIRDLQYALINPFNNFENLYKENKEKYIEESLLYFNSNASNLKVLNFIYSNLLEASGIWERKLFKYSLITFFYKIWKAIIRIRNYPQNIFKISITKTKEHRRAYIRILFFKLTIKLKGAV
ncbi:glycosyltransferase family 2 protein [Brachyspira aalborgi]|uniref:glycosyltransferase family 2 protein n=1 Tax=Brachyspira aalborgi TaxID=29522 RepID=UPI0011CAB6CD|nr:glycosyltransferase family 2 protein [Brachyspira aalborgi]TXJ54227.1 glycosyltransferase family 2 protein [Brachyspira aalborgi]